MQFSSRGRFCQADSASAGVFFGRGAARTGLAAGAARFLQVADGPLHGRGQKRQRAAAFFGERVLHARRHLVILRAAHQAEALKLSGDNIVIPEFADGPYHNFPRSQKIADGVWYIPARGHTKGNCIVIAECGGLYYMMHGDVTYTDEALVQNKLSIVFEDKAAARETLEQVREFVKNNPTVYLSTHTPLGVSNLKNKTVMKLD